MKSLKRFLAMLTAFAMTVAMTACSKDGDSDESSQPTVTTAPIVESVGDLDYSEVPFEENADPDFTYTIEAEECTAEGSVVAISEGDVSFVTNFRATGDSISFEVELPCDGVYDINAYSQSSGGTKENLVLVDGASVGAVATQNDWGDAVIEKVLMTAGAHTISIAYKTGGIDVDKITISASKPADISIFNVSKTLVNPNANDETQRLYNFLCDVYGKYTLSGQYADTGIEAREFKEIYKATGEYPAMLGLDLIEASPSRVSNGSSPAYYVPALEYWSKGGIISMCWHWNAPEKYLEVNGEPWWRGFYTEATNISLKEIMNGNDTEGYDLLIRDIDAIAVELKKLEDAGIPILWRPLHEASGGWFWWGASGADAYKELWVLMYDRLTNYHNINNLIWVWNGQNPEWYPGDEYVDIMGWDIYADKQDYSSQSKTFERMVNTTETNKIIALTENGVLFDPDLAMSDGSRWAWFTTWNGDFVIGNNMQYSEEYTSLDMLKKVYSHERVLTLDELPDLKCYPIAKD